MSARGVERHVYIYKVFEWKIESDEKAVMSARKSNEVEDGVLSLVHVYIGIYIRVTMKCSIITSEADHNGFIAFSIEQRAFVGPDRDRHDEIRIFEPLSYIVV